MAWLAVNRDKTEIIFEYPPYRCNSREWAQFGSSNYVKLPKGTIRRLIWRKLTWEDKPVELK